MTSIETEEVSAGRPPRPVQPLAWPLLIALCAVALNQRTFIASFGALVPEIRERAQVGDVVIGAVASLPLVCFALLSAAAPRVLNAWGQRRAIAVALVVLAAGVATRGLGSVPSLFVGTVVAGIAVTMLNVALPGVVRARFADRVGWATGAYSVVGAVGTAAAASITVPLHRALGVSWGVALAMWAAPVVFAVVIWLGASRELQGTVPEPPTETADRTSDRKLVLILASYLGFQSVVFFCLLSWLPDILHAEGFSVRDLGIALATVQIASIPATLFLPALADRMRIPALVVLLCGGAQMVGLGWVATAPGRGYPVWAVLLGIGTAAFPLGMYLVARCARSVRHANLLSARSQFFAYVLAALGPFVIGYVKDATGSWTAGLGLLIVMSSAATTAGLFADRNARRHIESSK